MDFGLVLFTSDRGITPAAAAKAADEHGFSTFYVPEHTHIPVKRDAAHPTTGDETLPDDRSMRIGYNARLPVVCTTRRSRRS